MTPRTRSIVGWLLLLTTVLFGLLRQSPPEHHPLPTQTNVRVCFVPQLMLAALPPGAIGVMPSRAGRVGEQWGWRQMLETGSRSPVSPTNRVPELIDASNITLAAALESAAHETVVIVAADPGSERLTPLLIAGPTIPAGLLTSPSTRFTPGLIAATDLATTVAALAGRDEQIGAGRAAVVVAGSREALASRVDAWTKKATAQRFLVVVPWVLVGCLALGFRWPSLARLALALTLGLIVVPVVFSSLWLYLGAVVLAILLASRLTTPQLAVALTLLLWADVTLGGPFLDRSPLSFSVTEAARFHGIGNEAAGLLLGSALLMTEGWAILSAAPLLLAVALAIGSPTLGINTGCFAAALVGVLGRVIVAVPKERRILAGAVALVLATGLIGGIGVWDARRGSESRTHLGQAVAGDRQSAGEMLRRKLAMNAHLLLSSPWSLLLLTELGVVVWRGRRGERADPVTLVAALTALVLNDSGVLAAATALLPETTTPPRSE